MLEETVSDGHVALQRFLESELRARPAEDVVRARIEGALRLSAPVVSKDASLLCGQLLGRLRGLGPPELDRLLDELRARRRGPWLRPITQSLTSPLGTLRHSLVAKNERLDSLVITPDGGRLSTTSRDYQAGRTQIECWDLQTGESGGSRTVEGMVVAGSDGVHAVLIDPSGAISMVELETWRVVRSMPGRYEDVSEAVLSEDMRFLVLRRNGPRKKALILDWVRGRIGLVPAASRIAVGLDGACVISRVGIPPRRAGCFTEMVVWQLPEGKERFRLKGHTHDVSILLVTPDGRRAITASGGFAFSEEDSSIRVWDLATGAMLQVLASEDERTGVRSLLLTPDGRQVIAGHNSGRIRVWDLAHPSQSYDLEGHTDAVDGLALSEDGQVLVSAGHTADGFFACDTTVRVWSLKDRTMRHVLQGHVTPAQNIAITRDGSTAVTSCATDIKVWDIRDMGADGSAPRRAAEVMLGAAFTRAGDRVVTCSVNGFVEVWDPETGALLRSCRYEDAPLRSMELLPDDESVVTAAQDGTLIVWNVREGTRRFVLREHEIYVAALAVSPDGRRLISGDGNGCVIAWDLTNGRESWTTTHVGRYVISARIDPTGRRIVCSSEYTAYVLDLETGRILHEVTLEHAIEDIVILSHGRLAVLMESNALAGAVQAPLRVWNLETGELGPPFGAHRAQASAITLLDDTRVVSASYDGTVKIWSLPDGELLHVLGRRSTDLRLTGVHALAVTPDARRLLCASWDYSVCLWDLENASPLARFIGEDRMFVCAVDATGTRCVAGDYQGRVHFLAFEEDAP